MAYRKLDNIKQKIEEAAIHIGATKGVKEISARNIAKECGISTHTIYQFYESIDALVLELATRFEQYCMRKNEEFIAEGKTPYQLCDFYLTDLLSHKEFVLFYVSFIDAKSSDFKYLFNNKERCIKIARCLFKLPEKYGDKEYLLFYEYTTTLIFKFIRKSLSNPEVYNDETLTLVKKLVMDGVRPFIQ